MLYFSAVRIVLAHIFAIQWLSVKTDAVFPLAIDIVLTCFDNFGLNPSIS